MPYEFETKRKKLPKNLDRRIKLSEEDKIDIEILLSKWVSQNQIAKHYWVSRKTIYYIKYPDKLKKDREQYKIRRLDWRYYNREKHTRAIKKTRNHKQKNKDLLI